MGGEEIPQPRVVVHGDGPNPPMGETLVFSIRLLRVHPDIATQWRALVVPARAGVDDENTPTPDTPFFGTISHGDDMLMRVEAMQREKKGTTLAAPHVVVQNGVPCRFMVGMEYPVYMGGPGDEGKAALKADDEAPAFLYPVPSFRKTGMGVELLSTLEYPPQHRAILDFRIQRVTPKGLFPAMARASADADRPAEAIPFQRTVFETRMTELTAPIHDKEMWVLSGLEDYVPKNQALIDAERQGWTVPVILVFAQWHRDAPTPEHPTAMPKAWLDKLMPTDSKASTLPIPQEVF